MALSFDGIWEAYKKIVEFSKDFSFDFVDYEVTAFDTPWDYYSAICY